MNPLVPQKEGAAEKVQQIQASHGAWAAILGSTAVVTWHDATGGDSSAAQQQLKIVQDVQASYRAKAAILSDRFVFT